MSPIFSAKLLANTDKQPGKEDRFQGDIPDSHDTMLTTHPCRRTSLRHSHKTPRLQFCVMGQLEVLENAGLNLRDSILNDKYYQERSWLKLNKSILLMG